MERQRVGADAVTDIPAPPPGFTLIDEPPAPPPGFTMIRENPQAATRMDRFATGAGDLIQGGAQLAVNALPRGVVDAVNDATAWVNRQPVVGPVTRALGMTPATPEQVNQGVAQREADYQASRQAGGAQPGDTDWYRIGGQIAGSLPMAAVAPAGATLPRALLSGAAQGAALGAAQPVADVATRPYWEQVQENATTGALTGAAGGAAGNLVGRVIGGNRNVNPNVRTLHEAGVQMTPGQIAGGYAQRVEDAAGSIPFVGQTVRNAQRSSMESFNRSVANNVLKPLGQRIDDAAPVGRDLVDDVYTRIGAAYDAALPRVRPFGPDQQFYQDLGQAMQQIVTPEGRNSFNGFVRNNILSRVGNGQMDGQTFKLVEEELGRVFRQYRSTATPEGREFAEAALGVQQAFRDLLGRTNPAVSRDIRAANDAFARYIRMERAAASVAATDGVFTPAQFSRAVQASDRSGRRGAYARGDALMQDLGDAGRAVLPRTVPDSGTPERAMIANLLLGGGAGIGIGATGGGMLPALAGAGMAAGAYTAPSRSLLQLLALGARPAPVQAAGGAISRLAPSAAVPLGGLWLEPPPPPQ